MKRPKYVAFATQKGGAGKTTITVLVASYLHYTKGLNIAIIDCDFPQHSICEMRNRETDLVKNDLFYKVLAYKQLERLQKKGYPVVEARFDTALAKAQELSESGEFDYIFFDLPGTINASGITDVIKGMEYIITPIIADRVVLESSLRFATVVNDKLISTGGSSIKGLYMLWNMVDRRERTDLYEIYEETIESLGISIMTNHFPDSKRFRREGSESHRPIFRSTLFPIDRTLVKGSNIVAVVDEFLELTKE